MQNQTIVGIDVSSATLDICVINDQGQQSFAIKNEVKTISKFFKAYSDPLIIGMENTGRYNWFLYEALKESIHRIFVVSPLHLKKSMGLVRGKNDKIDAVRVAAFIQKNHVDLPQWKPSSQAIQQLKVLLSERNCRVKSRKQLVSRNHDYSRMKHLDIDKELKMLNQQQLKLIDKQIAIIEKKIESVISSDEQMQHQAKLIRSIPGVGKVLSWIMLAKTESFQLITEPRKLACYSGVVPFANQSGSSLKGKNRVSSYADKAIKTVLHLAAMSAIRLNNDLQTFYLKKVAEGKNKMSVLNAVRNKIIHRIFAVIKNERSYQSHLVLS
jgi:transposase